MIPDGTVLKDDAGNCWRVENVHVESMDDGTVFRLTPVEQPVAAVVEAVQPVEAATVTQAPAEAQPNE